MACVRCIVQGLVQGVWYRDSTRRKAHELNIKGHAINLPDGSVEVLACGGEAELKVLMDWLWQGPEMARVDSVKCNSVPDQAVYDFKIG